MIAGFDAIERVHHLMSFHESGSDVSRLNTSAAQQPVSVDPWTWEVLQLASELYRLSRGVFDCRTIPLRPEAKACKKIQQLSVARLLGEAIKRIHHGDSISSLFI